MVQWFVALRVRHVLFGPNEIHDSRDESMVSRFRSKASRRVTSYVKIFVHFNLRARPPWVFSFSLSVCSNQPQKLSVYFVKKYRRAETYRKVRPKVPRFSFPSLSLHLPSSCFTNEKVARECSVSIPQKHVSESFASLVLPKSYFTRPFDKLIFLYERK